MHRLFTLTIAASLLSLTSFSAARAADIPALIQALSGQDRAACLQAVDELGKLGPEAKPAVPALVQTLAGDDEQIGRASCRERV